MPKRTVLLVEPNDERRARVREALQRAGYHVEEAVTPEHGLWSIQARSPDLLIAPYPLHTDQRDPFITAARELLDGAESRAPIVALTRSVSLLEQRRAELAGADQQCSMDIPPKVLAAMVRKMIGASRD